MSGSPRERFFALPKNHPLKIGLRLLIYLAIAFVVICAYLYVMQNRMIYAGSTLRFTSAEVLELTHENGVTAWSPDGKQPSEGFVLPDFHDPVPRGTIVLLHGNGEFAWERSGMAQTLHQHGFRTYLYEYPGFGGRSGQPSELAIVPEVRAVIRALDHAGLGPVYVWGQSLGSGVAAAVCADESLPVHGLILITPWDTLPNVGASHYPFIPVHWLMIDRYDSVANLANFKHPICLLRSDHDEVVPPPLSLNLYAHLPKPKKEIVFQNASHNSWPGDTPDSWWNEALDFVAPR